METIKIELPIPETIDGEEIKVLELRRPIGADVEDIVGAQKLGEAITELASKLVTNVVLTPDDIRAFDAKNYMKISEALMGFLA